MDYDYMEFAEWLVNLDSEGAEDETFAEFFVALYKIWNAELGEPVTKEDMKTFPIDEFTNWLNACLHEIIDEHSDCCKSAWWKKED